MKTETKAPAIAAPVPLTSPDGVVRGYACPRCWSVHSVLERNSTTLDDFHSRDQASHCGVCYTCNKPFACHSGYKCPECKAAEAELHKQTEPLRDKQRQEADEYQLATYAKANVGAFTARSLASAMSDISEDYYCAGWLSGLEFTLWDMLTNSGSRDFGLGTVTESELKQLRELHELAGGWIYWDVVHNRTCFAPTAEWLERFNKR